MEALGRVFDVVPIASGVAISLKNCSGITFVCTGADTFTLTVAPTFAGSYVTPGTIINHYYQAAATNGTAAWTRQTQVAADNVVQGSAYTTVIEVFGSQIPDPNTYIKCTRSAAGLVMAVLHDLTVQRKPANLAILSA
jgi:hypothetical protein